MNERGLRHVGRVAKHARPGRVRRAPTRLVEYQNQKKTCLNLKSNTSVTLSRHVGRVVNERWWRTCRRVPEPPCFGALRHVRTQAGCRRIPRRRARELLCKGDRTIYFISFHFKTTFVKHLDEHRDIEIERRSFNVSGLLGVAHT